MPVVTAAPPTDVEVARIQRRTLRLLITTQSIGGIGVTFGVTVGALLAARLAGVGSSGLAQSAAVVGAALLAVPVSRVMRARGRRPGLVLAYLVATVGCVLVVTAAATRWVPLLFVGMLCFGGGTTANLQARFTAADLAPAARRGRDLSIVVWATTVGAVLAPLITAPADAAAGRVGLPEWAGPFAFSVLAFLLAAGLLLLFLRPDPLLTARRVAAAEPGGLATPGAASMRAALRVVLAIPAARLGMGAIAVGHLVMVGVMSMTPVHLGESHGDADVLRIVGLVLSVHIAGMYALSPLVGWLTDRLGRRPVILGGLATLVAACAVAGTAGHDTSQLTVGLALLGLGWSGTMVAGSTLLSESVRPADRPAAQGLSDLVMGLAGASAAASSGLIAQVYGYPVLNLLAALATVPLVALALRPGVTKEERAAH